MIKYLAFEYQSLFSFLNIFSYITFRAGASILTGLFFSLIFGNYIINKLSNVQPTGQPIRDDGPESHIIAKKGTPTMGGLLIILSVFVSTIIWADLQNIFIWILLSTILIFGSIGFADDYSKIKSNTSKGISSKIRIISISKSMTFPFFKNLIIDFGIFYFLISIFIIIGSANAVNLTDGLDGLAIVPVMIVAMSFAFIAYVSGNIVFSNYLLIQYIPGTGELAVFCGSLIGAALGFLWFNAPPAKVFMGDTGSLALGGSLGSVAII